MEVTVVGCGVSGLTTAIELRRRGHESHIVAAQMPHEVVSAVAGAIWGPTSVEPRERTAPWALISRERFAVLAEIPSSGVSPMVHTDLRADLEPHWGERTPWVTRLEPQDVPSGYRSGLRIDGFIIDPPTYLTWLLGEFERLGGTIELRHVDDVTDVPGEAVVNCTGLGAAELVGDREMFAIRGQMVLVPNDGITDGISDELDQDRISYVYPRPNHLYLGGQRSFDDTRTEPDPALRDRIVADAARLDPRTADRPVVDERVGFRPGRTLVRLDHERLADGRTIVHNYGHGGAGFIMSWGCAVEVADLLDVG